MPAKLTPWSIGMDNVSDKTSLPSGAVVDAANGVFTEGAFLSRAGLLRVQSGTASFAANTSIGSVYVLNNELVSDGVILYTLLDTSYVSYTELHNGLLVSTPRDAVLLSLTNAPREFLIDTPVTSIASTDTNTKLPNGQFVVVTTFVDNEEREGPASLAVTANGSAVAVISSPSFNASVTRYRVYAGYTHSELMYRVGEATVGTPVVYDDPQQQGALCELLHKEPMIFGRYTTLWRGRLLSARGRVLYLSDPLNYHIRDPREGFVQFPELITFVIGVDGGVFVGQQSHVAFLRGPAPKEWHLQRIQSTPIPNAAVLVPANELAPKIINGEHFPVALWLSRAGFVVGLPSGQVLETQADRIAIPAYPSAALSVSNRVVTAYIHQRY